MQLSLTLQNALPSIPQDATPSTFSLKGSNINTAIYATPLASLPANVAAQQLQFATAAKAPGQKGSSRAQCLAQTSLIDANGVARVISVNITMTFPTDFIPQEGTSVNLPELARANLAHAIGALLNPQNLSSGQTPNAVIDALFSGLLP